MSWHYLQELEGESLEDICSDGEPCAPLKLKTTHGVFFSNGKLMDVYLDSLSGTMLQPSTDTLGKEKSMSSAEDSPVKTFPLLAKEKGLEGKEVDSGEKWPASLAKFDPVSSSWRTHQCLLFEDSTECLETLPKWGMMRNGECWEAEPLDVQLIESVSGSLPIAPSGCRNRGNHVVGRLDEWGGSGNPWRGTNIGKLRLPDFEEWVMGWPVRWSKLMPFEKDKFQQWQHLHGQL